MKKLNKKAHQFLKNRRGQSTIEYILILMIVIMVVLKFKKDFSDRVGEATDGVAGGIQRVIQELNNTE